ncbi:hypothetical protein BGZ94_002680, partial [Podila epigama]
YQDSVRTLGRRQREWLEAIRETRQQQRRDHAVGQDYADYEFDDDYDDDEELDGGDENILEEETVPQGSTTSARLRMHHEMVQQMRVRAGYAPEPFPGDLDGEGGVNNGQDNGHGGGEGEGDGDEDDGGVGPSNGISSSRVKKIGKKKAEKLQRKEQMRAYHEFMTMQREERRQQEEMFRVQESLQHEERLQQRAAQQEKERKRKEQRKLQEAKENTNRLKKLEQERVKDEKARKELYAYLQKVKSFRISTLATRFHRTEAQVKKDLAAITSKMDDPVSETETEDIGDSPRIYLASSLSDLVSSSSSPSSSPRLPRNARLDSTTRPHLLVLYMAASDQYVVLDQSTLSSLAEVVKDKGRLDKKELCAASQVIFSKVDT